MQNATTKKSDVVARRLYARGKWKLESVAHFGGEETGVADMCLLQDAERKTLSFRERPSPVPHEVSSRQTDLTLGTVLR